MLYEHSGRIGFQNVCADPVIPTPSKGDTCAMLRRETELRNDPATQLLLDQIEHDAGEYGSEKQEEDEVQTLEEAQLVIDALRAELESLRQEQVTPQRDVAAVESEGRSSVLSDRVHNARCDKEVFEAIKAQVVEEFGLPPSHVDVLNTAVSRFPGDQDIVEAANYIKYNRAHQGDLKVGDQVPIDSLNLATLSGDIAPLRAYLAPTSEEDHRPVAIVAGSIT